MTIGFLFPGQGTQKVGMGKDIYEKYDEAKKVYDEVKELTNIDIAKISFEGPEEVLNETKYTQLAIVAMSLAILEILKNNGITPLMSAGLSLGEYVALVAGGVLSKEDAIKLIEKRGKYMQELLPEGNWKMAAIFGLSEEQVIELCNKVKSGFVVPANFNTSEQIVISGEEEGVIEAEQIAKEMGAKKVRLLNTAGPFHTIKLKKASEALRKELEKVEFKSEKLGKDKAELQVKANELNKIEDKSQIEPNELEKDLKQSQVIKNLDGKPYTADDNIKEILEKHIINPVRFSTTIQTMLESGIDTFVEIGPGKTLSSFVKREKGDKDVDILNIGDVATLENTIAVLKENYD